MSMNINFLIIKRSKYVIWLFIIVLLVYMFIILFIFFCVRVLGIFCIFKFIYILELIKNFKYFIYNFLGFKRRENFFFILFSFL